ncbi:hypothetical protein GN958_ATG14731 [Phytophthora infestans]|uniref:Uncharacterized protein n=1 Tax=Phytophthora infestans TaxID=4787 RepID=A0A8S9UCQ5_PHYIN|nr:hypothetical protein GN958_ATG14731 [Phytophthora infestans]
MSPAKRTGKSSGKVPSTTPPVSPSSMSPTDLRVLAQALSDQVQTLTAELQTAQDAQDQAASLHTTQLQTLRAQIHDQAMEIQGWEHRAASRSQDLRLLLADQAVEIRDLTGRLDRASRQRDVMRDDNDHLLREMALAGSEIHQLQSRIHDLERDLEDSQTARAAADVSLDRLRDELRLTQEEVVTNDYVGSAHDGSALGSARGGSPAPNPPPSSPDVALAQLSEELQDTKESLERASAGRDYALEEFVRMTRLRDEIQTKLADSELQRDKATTEWADAERALTELESKLRRMSDKLKKADATTAKLQDQLSAAQTQQQQLILERDRGLSERDLARRRLALVTAAVSDPLPPLSGPSQAASVSAPLPTVSGADSSTAKRPRSTSPAPSTGSSRPHKQARASPKAKPKTTPVSKSAPQAGSTSLSKAGSTPAPKTSVSPSKSGAGSKSGSTARSKSTSASKTGPVATSKTGSTVSKPGSTSKTGSTAAASKSGSGPKTGSTASKAGSVAPSKTGSAVSKSGSTAKTGSTAVSKSGSASTTRVQRIQRRLEPLRRPWRKTRGGLYPNPDPKPGGDPSRRRLHKSLAQPDPEAPLRDLRSTSTVTVDRAVMVGGGRLVVADSLDLAEGVRLVADLPDLVEGGRLMVVDLQDRPMVAVPQDRLMVADPRDRLTVADPLDLS